MSIESVHELILSLLVYYINIIYNLEKYLDRMHNLKAYVFFCKVLKQEDCKILTACHTTKEMFWIKWIQLIYRQLPLRQEN